MIRALLKKELLSNMLSFKFIACLLVAILVSLQSTALLSRDYLDRLREYDKGNAQFADELTRIPVFSCLNIKIFKKPSTISIFVSGTERESGSFAQISLANPSIPTSLEGGVLKNELSVIFPKADVAHIIIIVFSLLAILLSYNSVSGEKENGTLSLMLSHSLPRYKILLSKYLGALVSIVVALALQFIFSTLFIFFSKDMAIDGTFLKSLGLIFATSSLYLSCFLFLGILVSSLTKRAFTSLLILLGYYILFIFIIPAALKSSFDDRIFRSARSYDMNIEKLAAEKDRDESNLYRDIPQVKTWSLRDVNNMRLYGGLIFSRVNPREALDNQARMTEAGTKLERDYAEKIYGLRSADMRSSVSLRQRMNRLLALVPSSSYLLAVELMSDTGNDSMTRYLERLHIYWRQVMSYLEGRNAFGFRFFFPGPPDLTLYEKELVAKINEDKAGLLPRGRMLSYVGKYSHEAQNYRPQLEHLDLSDMPAFVPPALKAGDRLVIALPVITVLLGYNFVLFMAAYFSLQRYDPRRDS